MKEGPDIARIAALIGDPARANMLTALMGGRALTAAELAAEAGITPQTASTHLSKMTEALILQLRRQGRHRYYAIYDENVANVVAELMGLAERAGLTRTRTGPRDAALRTARSCYNHLAGDMGVALLQKSASERAAPFPR
ncbi:MAG: ArsR/SmtB family transcription factor [Paracoccus sp. (in: a-proteobacteria)]